MRYRACFAYDMQHPEHAVQLSASAIEISVAFPGQRFSTHQRHTVLPCQHHNF